MHAGSEQKGSKTDLQLFFSCSSSSSEARAAFISIVTCLSLDDVSPLPFLSSVPFAQRPDPRGI